jgi:hypothetical protein
MAKATRNVVIMWSSLVEFLLPLEPDWSAYTSPLEQKVRNTELKWIVELKTT